MDDASPGLGVLTTDLRLAVRSWNHWLATATDLSESDVQGRSLIDLVPVEQRAAIAEILAEVLETGGSRVLASAFHHFLIPCAPTIPSARFARMQQCVTVAALASDHGPAGLLITIDDVTARRDAERGFIEAMGSSRATASPDEMLAAVGADDWRIRGAAVQALRQAATREEVVHLLETLQRDHHDLNVLSSALQIIIATNRDVTAPLVQLLEDPSSNLRMHAALALGGLNDATVVPALLRALDDEDSNVRFHAIEALGRLRAPAAVEPLARIAQTGDFFLAFPAIDALARIDDASVALTLVALLDEELLRPAVIDSLAALGDEDSVEPLVALLNGGAGEVGAIAAALERIYWRYERAYDVGDHIAECARHAATPAAIARLIEAVRQRQAPVTSLVVVLGWMGPAGTDTLVGALGEPDAGPTVANVIARLGAPAVEPVIEQLRHGDATTRLAAAALLGRLCDRRAVPALVDALSAPNDELVTTAAAALASLGDPRALDALLPLFAHPTALVRQTTIAAINSIGAAGTGPLMRARLKDADPRVRECALRVAAYFGFDGAAQSVVDAVDDPQQDVRRAAIEQLPLLDDPRAMPRLLVALREESPRNRAAAAHALRTAIDQNAEAPLVAALDDPDPWVRYFAAGSLTVHGGASAIAALAHHAATDGAPLVRIAALQAAAALDRDAVTDVAFGSIDASDDDLAAAAVTALARSKDARVDAVLERAAHDPRPSVRAAATQSLGVRGHANAPDILAFAARTADSPGLAASAVDALRRIASSMDAQGQEAALAALVELGTHPDHRDALTDTLATLPPHTIAQVSAGFSSPRVAVRRLVVEVLTRMRHRTASEELARALIDDDPSIRAAAVVAFGRLGTPTVGPTIQRLQQTDPDAGVRRCATVVCERHGWTTRSSEKTSGKTSGETP